MKLNYLDKEEYKDIPVFKMVDNRHGNLPFYIRKYAFAGSGPHRHEYMQINYVRQGRGKHFIARQEFNIIKGDIFVIPPYIPHRIDASEESQLEIYEFEFEPEFINQNFQDINQVESFFDFAYLEPFLVAENQVRPRLNLVGKQQIEVEAILDEVHREFMARKPGFMLLVKSLLLKLLVVVGREFTKDLEDSEMGSIFDRHRDAIFGSIQYIDENYGEDLNVENVARRFMLSRSYYSYLFKSITSKTFLEYLTNIRLSKAMELLRSTDNRVIDICYETGFKNVNHFNRLFKQQTGLSPLEFRKNV